MLSNNARTKHVNFKEIGYHAVMWESSFLTTQGALMKDFSVLLHSDKTAVTLKHELQKATY